MPFEGLTCLASYDDTLHRVTVTNVSQHNGNVRVQFTDGSIVAYLRRDIKHGFLRLADDSAALDAPPGRRVVARARRARRRVRCAGCNTVTSTLWRPDGAWSALPATKVPSTRSPS